MKKKIAKSRNRRHLLLGAHQSIAGGAHQAIERASTIGCSCVQIFTKSPRSWKEPPPPSADDIETFKHSRQRLGIAPVLAHASYLVNPCAADPALRQKGWDALVADARRCDTLGIEMLVFHPGTPGDLGDEVGMDLVADCLRQTLAKSERVALLVENTAGQGNGIGHRFNQLATIIDRAGGSGRVGVCFDTCHAFAAGYDLGTARSAARTFDELASILGRDRLLALHLNDSQSALGSRVDRHARIGRGQIGIELFRWIMRRRRFAGLPAIIETPIAQGDTYRDEIALLKSMTHG